MRNRQFVRLAVLCVAVLCLATGRAHGQPELTGTGGYVLQGTVRDSSTDRPVAGLYVWPIYSHWGAVTDSVGHYEIRWPRPSSHIFFVRGCTERNLATIHVDFRDSLVLNRDAVIAADPGPCPSGTRAPWAVDASDTVTFNGYYIYSWEGGGWLKSCDRHSTYRVDWESPLGPLLNRHRRREGQRTFVRARGRIAQHEPAELPTPQEEYVVRLSFPGPLFLVAQVEEVREPRRGDCR
jgi:hypothetical protein